jgi:hypothetical protein
MEEQNTVLEEETLDTEVDNEEYIDETEYADETDDQEEPTQDEEESEQEDDVEVEYDEDGNVVEHVAEEDEDATESEGDAEVSNDTETAGARGVKHADEGGEDFRAKYEALRRQTGDTLKKLGVDTEDPIEGLESLAADAEGLSLEEYRNKKSEAERTEKAEMLLKQQEFERIAAQDLAELQAEFPETRAYKNLLQMPQDVRSEFARLRGLGLPAKQAYAAANVDGIRATVAASAKKSVDNKAHLHTAVPKNAKNTTICMTRAELAQLRDCFPNKTDKEIIALYKQTKSN